MLKLVDISKSFGHKEVLHHISLDVDQPLIYGLLGPNGAGKTSLIRTICGILKPDSGNIIFNEGISLTNISYMPDTIGLYTDMTIMEEIKYFGLLKGVSVKETLSRVAGYIERLQLMPYLKTPVSTLSKGTARKVQFVCTLINLSKIIILDEPFSGLDPIGSAVMEDIILELKKAGVTILLSTHRMEHAETFCDHIFIINEGQLLIDDSLQHLKLRHLKSMYTIESMTPIFFPSPKIVAKEKYADIYHYTISVDEDYTFQQMLKEIGEQEVLQLNRKTPALKDIFVDIIQKS